MQREIFGPYTIDFRVVHNLANLESFYKWEVLLVGNIFKLATKDFAADKVSKYFEVPRISAAEFLNFSS